MRIIRHLVLFVFFLYGGFAFAQPDMVWMRFRYDHTWNKSWSIYGESDLRPFIRSGDMFQYLFRVGSAHRLGESLRFEWGTALFHSVRNQEGKLLFAAVNENRIFASLSGKQDFNHCEGHWRVMLEERSFSNATPALRFRYLLGVSLPFKTFSLFLADEYFHQYRYAVSVNRYDQNRIMLFARFPMKKNALKKLEFGPMLIMQGKFKPGILALRGHLIFGNS